MVIYFITIVPVSYQSIRYIAVDAIYYQAFFSTKIVYQTLPKLEFRFIVFPQLQAHKIA